MWLIDRDTNGCSGSRIPLPPALRQALVSWYVGKGSFHDEHAGITLVQNARIGFKWLACDCLGPSAPPPILTPAFLSEAETYYLRRLTGSNRPEHKEACPFFRDQATNRITEVRNRSTPADPPSGFFEVLKPAPENLSQRPEEDVTDDRTRNASVPRMARLLWRLLDTAGVNTVAPISAGEERSIRAGFSAIGYAAGRIEIAPGIELARAFWSHHRPLQTNAVYATLRRLGREWPRDHAPQGFVLMYAKAIRGRDIQVADGELITIANRIQSPSVRGNRIEGPYRRPRQCRQGIASAARTRRQGDRDQGGRSRRLCRRALAEPVPGRARGDRRLRLGPRRPSDDQHRHSGGLAQGRGADLQRRDGQRL